MEKKIVVISGASSGIGKQTAKLFCENNFTVYGLNRSKGDIEGVVFIETDITSSESIKHAINIIIEKEGKIDILINNAGMGISGSIENTDIDRAEYIFDVNFFGAFQLTKEVLPYMRENGGGRIINISSLAAIFYLPFQGFYSASKAAVSSLFNALQLEVRPFNIKISTILPGDIKTGFTSNRKKNIEDNTVYASRIEKSVSIMEKDEQNGMEPIEIGKEVLRQAKKKNPKLNVVVGTKYKILATIAKILPSGLINSIIYLIYGGK